MLAGMMVDVLRPHPAHPVRDAVIPVVAQVIEQEGNVEGDLLYAYDMAAVGEALQPHLWARLKRA